MKFRKFIKFIEEDLDGNIINYIFPYSCNIGAYKILYKNFPNVPESNYRVCTFELPCTKNQKVNFNLFNLDINTRYINGMINTFELKHYIKATNNGDDYFENHGILKLVAYFIDEDTIY